MSFDNTSEKSVDLDRQENITKGVLSAKKVAIYTYDSNTDTLTPGVTVAASSSQTITKDTFGSLVMGSRYNQVEIDYSTTAPASITDITVTNTSGGSSSNVGGQAQFTSGTNTSGGVKAVTNTSITYRPHAESYVAFTAIFTPGIASSYQRIGLYDTNNGFFIGYEGTSFGITKRSGATDTRVAQASFSVDTLTGGSTSLYTRNGTPEAADFTKDNLFRIRFGWLGAAPILYEILSPDGDWVTFHKFKHPNTTSTPSIQNPNLPITLDIQKTTAGATALVMNTACWAAGSTSDKQKVSDTITDNTLASLNRSVITGRTTAGGTSYVNVKVTPSGSLTTAIGDISGVVGQQTKANSLPVTIASDQSIGGGTEYAEGATAATATGSVIMGKNGTTVKAAQTDASGNIRVDLSQTSANTTAIKVDNSAVTQPVSGTVTANAGTGNFTVTQSTAANLKVDLSGTAANTTALNINDVTPDLTTSISIIALSGTSGSITTLVGQSTYVFQLTGTWTATLQVQITADGTNWLNVTDSFAVNSHTLGTFLSGGNITTNGIYQIDITGLAGVRLISTAFTSGTVTGTARATKSDALIAVEGSSVIQGQAASGTTKLGNPLQIGGVFNTTTPTVTTGQMVEAQFNARGSQLVIPSDGVNNAAIKAASTASAFTDPALTIDARPGGALVSASAALADSLANPTLGQQAVLNSVFNGTTWDRQRGMSAGITTGDTGAKVATGNGATQTNFGNKGLQLVISLGAVTGTSPTAVFKLQNSVDAGTNWVDIPGATTASLTATGIYGISVFPGQAVTAGTTTTGTTATANGIISRSWRVVWTLGGTTPSFTITSITYNYLPY